MDLGLQGTAALVTGAAGGIGSATARLLAAEGARVAVHYHRSRAAAEAAIAHGLALSLKNEVVRTAPLARVNVVAPGWTVSPMVDVTDELVARVTATMALRKLTAPEHVARAIAWLCSPPAAGHVTGEVVTVAGGMERRVQR